MTRCSLWLITLVLYAWAVPDMALAQSASDGCPTLNTIEEQASGLSFPGDLSNRYLIKVPRVVGSGLPVEYSSSPDPRVNGTLTRITTFKNNGIVSSFAMLRLTVTLVLQPQYYALTQWPFNAPVVVSRQVRFRFNGNPVGSPVQLTATAVSQGTQVRRSVCFLVDTKFIRFGRLRQQLNPDSISPTGEILPITPATFNCPAGSGDPATPCPGLNDVSFDWSHEPSTGIDQVDAVGRLQLFNAMEPIILVGGCCEERGDFWESTHLRPGFTSLVSEMLNRGAPYFHLDFGRAIYGDIHLGALSVNHHVFRIAKALGSPWVHIVAHSKGGLNTRDLLLNNPNFLQSKGVGVLSVTFLQTPHRGSVAASAYRMLYDHPESPGVFGTENNLTIYLALRDRVSSERRLALTSEGKRTMTDLDPKSIDDRFSSKTSLLPEWTNALGIRRKLQFRLMVSDSNYDNSNEVSIQDELVYNTTTKRVSKYRKRTINDDERRPYFDARPYVNARLTAGLEAAYNMMGTTDGISLRSVKTAELYFPYLVPSLVSRQQVIFTSEGQAFKRNDFVVTVGSQSFFSSVNDARPHALFPIPPPPPPPTPDLPSIALLGPQASNHTACANNLVAQKILNFVIGAGFRASRP